MFVGGVPVAAFSAKRFPLPPIGPVTRATITAVRSDGWSATDTAPPATSAYNPSTDLISVQSQGFDSTGAAKVVGRIGSFTRRTRAPGTRNLSIDGRCAFSLQVYASDIVVGTSGNITNGSTVVSPKPICNWATPDGPTIGNTLTGAIIATHLEARNLEGVACVIVTATDGTNTVSTTVSQSAILGHPGDKAPVIGYPFSLDITSLTDKSAITYNGRVFPFIGTAASVADSSLKADGSANTPGTHTFCPQVVYKDVALATNPPLAYFSVGATGGTVSTDKATAKAAPFPDLASAAAAGLTYATNNGLANGISGFKFRAAAGSQVFGTLAASYKATGGEVIIEGDPDVADKTTTILSYGANTAFRVPALRLQNLREARTNSNAWSIQTATGGKITRENTSFDNTNGTAGPINTSSQIGRYIGFTLVGGNLSNNLSGDNRLLRGIVGSVSTSLNSWLVLGCNITGAGGFGTTTANTDDGTIIAFNYLMGVTGTMLNPAGGTATPGITVTGFALLQNVIEYVGPTNSPAFRPSGDGQTGNCTHFVEFNNTYAGGGQNGGGGRLNAYYDEKVGYYRQHTLIGSRGNIYVQLNQKSDLFLVDGTNDVDAQSHTGAWSFYYGVNCQGNISQYINAFGAPSDTSAASQAYTGAGSLFGSSTAAIDPKFVNDQSMSPKTPAPLSAATNTAGAGGSNLRTALGSPAKGIVTTAALRFDMDSKPRSAANDDCGAYLVAAS